MVDESPEDEELILGVVPPRRFVQGMAMLPAVTLFAMKLPAGWLWLAPSFGVAGTILIGIVVGRAAFAGRKLNRLFWLLLVAQLAALVLVVMRMNLWPF